ncbi:hypothetical protein Tco_0607864 [Tanacetum coccineum]
MDDATPRLTTHSEVRLPSMVSVCDTAIVVGVLVISDVYDVSRECWVVLIGKDVWIIDIGWMVYSVLGDVVEIPWGGNGWGVDDWLELVGDGGFLICIVSGGWFIGFYMIDLDGIGGVCAATYKRGLATVEDPNLITYRKNEVLFSEEVAVLKREVACKDYEINVLKSEFEKVKQEKDGIDFKIEKFDKASKDLDQLLGSQITDKSKKGLGYSAVPPPHPLIYNRPKKLDLSYSGLDEFKEPEFKGYGPENSEQESNVVCDKKSDNSKENSDESLVEEQVSQDKSSFVESSPNVDKETVFPVNKKVEFTKPKNHEKPVKKSVRYAEMYRSQSPRGNQRNWNGQKSNQLGKDFVMYNKACFICGSFNHLQINCDNHQRRGIVSRNNYNRVDAKTTHPSVHRNMSPKVVLLKTGLTPLNTVRPVKSVTVYPKCSFLVLNQRYIFVNKTINCQRHFTINKLKLFRGKRGKCPVKSSAYWVWRPTKPNGASLAFKDTTTIVIARGRTKSNAWVPKGI